MKKEKTFKVELTEKEIKSILDLAETEFFWNKDYPDLDSAIVELERYKENN